ncbi:MAG: class I SAM-dependent methyltransferase [Propionibacteriaceae bacterium]|nr:class I SAM-dependent methyltransferase [Propionibacteriaceae bacterium]
MDRGTTIVSMVSGQATFPEQALDWLVPEAKAGILALDVASSQTVRRFSRRGHNFVLVDPNAAALAKARARLPGVTLVCATAGKLPIPSCAFEAVLLTSANADLAAKPVLSELARVLLPGGMLVIQIVMRDDSVPWVRRLAEIVRRADPQAMSTSSQVANVEAIVSSPNFRIRETRDFRLWVPMRKANLLDQVRTNTAVSALPESTQTNLVEDVGHLYDSVARVGEPLRLPYKIACWRAEVVHLTPDRPWRDTSSLSITL